ncbi:MAG: hypothetical protein AABW73_04930 [Nanoarchaeota archaeon]
MKKGSKKFLTYLTIALIILSFTAITIAQEKSAEKVVDKTKKALVDWELGQFSPVIAKYLFAILVFLFIYPLVGMLPLFGANGEKFGNKILRFALAVIVSFLATAYLTPEDIQLTLVSYSSMGMVLGGVVPLLLLIFFTVEARRKAEKNSILLSYILWLGFIGFIVYKLVSGYSNDKIEAGGYLAYLIIIILSLTFLFLQGQIMGFLAKQGFEAEKTLVENKVRRLNLLQQVEEERLKRLESKKEGFD